MKLGKQKDYDEKRERENKNICMRIAQARCEAGLSQSEMAKKMDVSENTICNRESGRYKIYAVDLVKYSEVLGKPISWFYGIENEDEKTIKERLANDLIAYANSLKQ